MNNFAKPQDVGFVYFQNSPCQASTSGTSETLDYMEFSDTPNTSTGFRPGFSSSPQQFRQKNSHYYRGNRNKNYRQFHSNLKYQGNKQFSSNQNQRYSSRGNYSPRGNFNPRGRGNFNPRGRCNFSQRGNFNPRGNFQTKNKYTKKPYDKNDIQKYVNRSMLENPWEKLMSKIKITAKPSGSSNPGTSTVTSGDTKDEDMIFDSNQTESTEQLNVKPSGSSNPGTSTVTSGDSKDEDMIFESNLSESTEQLNVKPSGSSNPGTSTVTSGDSKDENMISDSNLSESTEQLNVEHKSTNSEDLDLTAEKISALSDSDKNVINSTESVAKSDTNSTILGIAE